MKNILLFCSFFVFLTSQAQTIVWQDDFENPANWYLNVSQQ
ncbi:MAG: hypothetical protein NT109_02930 [Flavobacteriia bacterium]|nr:hypothetical protein [Flavobacteriia bacterium]